MANEEQLSILKQGVEVWNKWRNKNPKIKINLEGLRTSSGNNFSRADFTNANLQRTDLGGNNLSDANLSGANLSSSDLGSANLSGANLTSANLNNTTLVSTDFTGSKLYFTDFSNATMGGTTFVNTDISVGMGLDSAKHLIPSYIGIDVLHQSKGKIPDSFLRGCGLSDWEIEVAKLYNPDLSNEEITNIQYKLYDRRATQAIQISPLFISYSHSDGIFVDKLETYLNIIGVRFWRDTHDMKAGRIETQIDHAIKQNPTVLLVLSEHSLSSDWVEHEVRTARVLEKEMDCDILCPVALDDSWKSSLWPKRVMEQIMEYNILDFSTWEDDVKFEGMFRKLIDGLELFYKG